jgi:hypothetical protein
MLSVLRPHGSCDVILQTVTVYRPGREKNIYWAFSIIVNTYYTILLLFLLSSDSDITRTIVLHLQFTNKFIYIRPNQTISQLPVI